MRSRYLVRTLAVLLLSVLATGCATIMKGTRQLVSVNSTPSDAKVTVYDKHDKVVVSRKTPCTVALERGAGYFQRPRYRVVVEKPGCEPAEIRISTRLNWGWYLIGNILLPFGGFGLALVDPLTGAMWSLEPEAIDATLGKKTSSLPRDECGLVVVLRERAPREAARHVIPLER